MSLHKWISKGASGAPCERRIGRRPGASRRGTNPLYSPGRSRGVPARLPASGADPRPRRRSSPPRPGPGARCAVSRACVWAASRLSPIAVRTCSRCSSVRSSRRSGGSARTRPRVETEPNPIRRTELEEARTRQSWPSLTVGVAPAGVILTSARLVLDECHRMTRVVWGTRAARARPGVVVRRHARRYPLARPPRP